MEAAEDMVESHTSKSPKGKRSSLEISKRAVQRASAANNGEEQEGRRQKDASLASLIQEEISGSNAGISQEGHAKVPMVSAGGMPTSPGARASERDRSQERVGTAEELLESLHKWQDEVSSKLAELVHLRPISVRLRTLQDEMSSIRQEMRSSKARSSNASRKTSKSSFFSNVDDLTSEVDYSEQPSWKFKRPSGMLMGSAPSYRLGRMAEASLRNTQETLFTGSKVSARALKGGSQDSAAGLVLVENHSSTAVASSSSADIPLQRRSDPSTCDSAGVGSLLSPRLSAPQLGEELAKDLVEENQFPSPIQFRESITSMPLDLDQEDLQVAGVSPLSQPDGSGRKWRPHLPFTTFLHPKDDLQLAPSSPRSPTFIEVDADEVPHPFRSHSSQSMSEMIPSRSTYQISIADTDNQIRSRCPLSRFQIHPDSLPRTAWDILSVIALVFDSVMIPFIIAWSPEVEGFTLGAMWATAVFWTTDVVVNLSTGYFTMNGDLEFRPDKILKRYLKSTMIMDLLICTTDWVGIVLDSQKAKLEGQRDSIALIRVIKTNRIIRIVRVLRVSNIWEKLERFNHLFLSNTAQVMMQVAAIFLFIVWLGHVLCCIWYSIGLSGSMSDTGYGWLDVPVNSLEDRKIAHSTKFYQYVTAYHWSMSQLTPGSMEVFPMNSTERVFTITLLLCGFLFCTSLISRLSALMVQLQMANQDVVRNIRRLRTFLRQNNIGASTAQRIEKQLKAQLCAKRLLSMEDIPILTKLSKPLLRDMKSDMFSHHMLCQPFFSTLDSISYKVTGVVCEMLDLRRLTPNEELFGKGEDTRMCFLLLTGNLLYMEGDPLNLCQSPTTSSMMRDRTISTKAVGTGKPMLVSKKYTWLCSAALWATWRTKGYCEAEDNCEVICMDGKAVLEAASSTNGRMASVLRHYHRAVNTLWKQDGHAKVNDIDDSWDHALVVLSLPPRIRMEISDPLFEVVRHRNWLRWGSAAAVKKLEDEVSLGKCALILTPDNQLVRVAIVVALRVYRPGGEVLMEVAQIEKGKCKRLAQYPGTKIREHEAMREAAQRVLDRLVNDLSLEQLLGVDDSSSGIDDGGSENLSPRSKGSEVPKGSWSDQMSPRLTKMVSLRESQQSVALGEPEGAELEWKDSNRYALRTQYRRNIFPVPLSGSTAETPPPLKEARGRRVSKVSVTSLIDIVRQKTPESHVFVPSETSVREMLDTECPYLGYHHPTHILWAKDQTKTTVYAWIREADVVPLMQIVRV